MAKTKKKLSIHDGIFRAAQMAAREAGRDTRIVYRSTDDKFYWMIDGTRNLLDDEIQVVAFVVTQKPNDYMIGTTKAVWSPGWLHVEDE